MAWGQTAWSQMSALQQMRQASSDKFHLKHQWLIVINNTERYLVLILLSNWSDNRCQSVLMFLSLLLLLWNEDTNTVQVQLETGRRRRFFGPVQGRDTPVVLQKGPHFRRRAGWLLTVDYLTRVKLFIGSKVLCVFCFGFCTPEGRGGEKGGSANF